MERELRLEEALMWATGGPSGVFPLYQMFTPICCLNFQGERMLREAGGGVFLCITSGLYMEKSETPKKSLLTH